MSRPEPPADSTARIAAIGVAILVGALFVWPLVRLFVGSRGLATEPGNYSSGEHRELKAVTSGPTRSPSDRP